EAGITLLAAIAPITPNVAPILAKVCMMFLLILEVITRHAGRPLHEQNLNKEFISDEFRLCIVSGSTGGRYPSSFIKPSVKLRAMTIRAGLFLVSSCERLFSGNSPIGRDYRSAPDRVYRHRPELCTWVDRSVGPPGFSSRSS